MFDLQGNRDITTSTLRGSEWLLLIDGYKTGKVVRWVYKDGEFASVVQRSEDGCDMRRFRSFNHSMFSSPRNQHG